MARNAKAGEELSAKAAARLRKMFPFMARVLSTKEACTVASKDPTHDHGQWICIDCGEPLPNNMMANMHAKSHRLAWWTGERFEEP